MKVPDYSVYNDPKFVKFIANYFGWEYKIIHITYDEAVLAYIPFVKRGSKWISLPFASVLGLGKVLDFMDETDLPYLFSFLYDKIKFDIRNTTYTLQAADLQHLPKRTKTSSIPLEFRSFIEFTENPYKEKTLSMLSLRENKKDQFSFFSGNVRRKVRKASKNKITVLTGRAELIDDFYLVYARNCHRLGSPIPNKDFYRILIETYDPANSGIFVAYHEGKPVGASILISYKKFWENIYFATDSQFNHLYPSYMIHWKMISYAIARCGQTYSFGRSTIHSGVHNYKKQWGTTDFPIYWNKFSGSFFQVRKINMLAHVWRILPEAIVRRLGPYFAAKYN